MTRDELIAKARVLAAAGDEFAKAVLHLAAAHDYELAAKRDGHAKATARIAELKAERDELAGELSAARETNRRLNRRTQEAEKAAADILRCSDHLASGNAWCGGNLGRAFLAWGNAKLRERVAELEAALKPFADYARIVSPDAHPTNPVGDTCPPAERDPDRPFANARPLPTIGDCRRAADILGDAA